MNTNRFSELYYESDDEKYEEQIRKEKVNQEEKRRLNKEKNKEKRMVKEVETKKLEEKKYANSLKRTKIFSLWFPTGQIKYISEIKEDGYNISNYLCLDGYFHTMILSCQLMYRLFLKDEYFELVKIMELNKNINYPTDCSLNDIRKIQHKMETAVISGYHESARIIYDIYLTFLLDTQCMRAVFEEPTKKYLMDIFKESVEEKILNIYGNISELESSYYNKYFEIGKRYLTKRKNFKVLFRNYVRFVGKLMILYKK